MARSSEFLGEELQSERFTVSMNHIESRYYVVVALTYPIVAVCLGNVYSITQRDHI